MGKSFVSSLLFLMLLCLPLASADGMIHIRDMDSWRLSPESQQYCMINFKNNTEQMLLLIEPSEGLPFDDAVWIFPVPAKPEDVDINIVKGFPTFMGEELRDSARDSIRMSVMLMATTQIYPAPLVVSLTLFKSAGFNLGATDSMNREGVTINKQVERMGLTTELVSASDSAKLEEYLQEKGLVLPDDSKKVLDEYVNQQYSFIVSWVSDPDEFRNATSGKNDYGWNQREGVIGVYASFLTTKPYYPLRLTSAYDELRIPTVIYVLGYVKPDLFHGIKEDAVVEYYRARYHSVGAELKDLYYGYQLKPSSSGRDVQYAVNDLRYTKIKLNSPSKNLTQDLWITPEAPKKNVVLESMNDRWLVWGVIIFIIISCLSSMAAGLFAFRDNEPSPVKFAFYGLTNFLTLIGFWIIAYLKEVDRSFCSNEKTINQELNLTSKQKASMAVPIILLILIVLLVPISWMLNIHELFYPWIFSYAIMFLALPIMIFTVLIQWGYYKHKAVLKFNLLFTAAFLILMLLSWLMVEMVI